MLIEVPQDILKREGKVMGNFSARQLILGGIGLGLGFVVGFIFLSDYSMFIRELGGAIAGFPFLAFGFINLYGQPLEKILPVIIEDNFLLPINRFYKSENIIEPPKPPSGKKEKPARPSRALKGIK